MTTSRLSKEQIAFSLRRSEGGTPTVDLLEARTAAMPVSMIVDCGLEFTSKALDDTWVKIKAWCVGYHPQRTQGSPGHLTASEFVRNRQENRTRKLAARWI